MRVMTKFRYEVIKTYPPRGPLQQYRLAAATSFYCFRCGRPKTSKLITTFERSWSCLLCNGCYGLLLSIHGIQADDATPGVKANLLAEQLLRLVPVDQARRSEELLIVHERRALALGPRALRLLATSEFVARQLQHTTSLDWSAAIIGLCKAVEVEVVGRLVEPLRAACHGSDLQDDIHDQDLARVARYCAKRVVTPPELGAVRYLLETAANSRSRRASSVLLGQLKVIVRRWPDSDWLFDSSGALDAMRQLTTRFRNPAAHTAELAAEDYAAGFDLVAGPNGMLWKLVRATTSK
jgi:hypothetical protein